MKPKIETNKNRRFLVAALAMQFGMLACSAQTELYLYTGSETTVTLNPCAYDITAYGAQGGGGGGYGGPGSVGGLGAGMSAEFYNSTSTTLTLLVGGSGGHGNGGSGGGGGGSFVVNGSTALVVAGGGGGGSIIDASGTILTEVSGIASPDDSPNGEIIITEVSEVPEPSTLALAALGRLGLLFLRRRQWVETLLNRNCTISLTVVLSAFCLMQSARAQETFTYTGNPFSYVGTSSYNGPVPTSISGYFTVSSPLAANTTYDLSVGGPGQTITDYSFTDGRYTDDIGNYAASAPGNIAPANIAPTFTVTTGADGNITSWELNFLSPTAWLYTVNFGETMHDGVVANPSQSYNADNFNSPGSWSVEAVPEPATLSLLGPGLVGLGLLGKHRHG